MTGMVGKRELGRGREIRRRGLGIELRSRLRRRELPMRRRGGRRDRLLVLFVVGRGPLEHERRLLRRRLAARWG